MMKLAKWVAQALDGGVLLGMHLYGLKTMMWDLDFFKGFQVYAFAGIWTLAITLGPYFVDAHSRLHTEEK